MKAIAWDGESRYLVVPDDARVAQSTLARIVDVRRDRVYEPPLQIGSIIVQEEPDVWVFEVGPEADKALELVDRGTTARIV